jgi:iron(III) transport system substrate-binding protein
MRLVHGLLWCLACLAISATGCRSRDGERVVLYCAHDREFAEPILEEFTRRTGLKIVARYDSEANKSVSLVHALLREANHPRCDVHWNNEILGTIRLERAGVLEPYASPSGQAFPAEWKGGTWHAFAARARVIVVNTKLVPAAERPRGLWDLTDRRWAKRVAMAKPQFGTTATQAACLFQAWGDDAARRFYRALHENGVQLLPGNKQVAEAVGRGEYALGLTDTDDAMAEIDAKNPVAMIFPDADAAADSRQGTLFIPNTVALIKGAPNAAGARKLIDYLLSAEVEEELARGPSRQIPLNPAAAKALPDTMAKARTARPLPVDFAKAADLWNDVQTFLTREIARP